MLKILDFNMLETEWTQNQNIQYRADQIVAPGPCEEE